MRWCGAGSEPEMARLAAELREENPRLRRRTRSRRRRNGRVRDSAVRLEAGSRTGAVCRNGKRGPGVRAGRRDYSHLPRFEVFWDFRVAGTAARSAGVVHAAGRSRVRGAAGLAGDRAAGGALPARYRRALRLPGAGYGDGARPAEGDREGPFSWSVFEKGLVIGIRGARVLTGGGPSAAGEAAGHGADGASADHSFAGGGVAFVVAGESAVGGEPGENPFDRPPAEAARRTIFGLRACERR